MARRALIACCCALVLAAPASAGSSAASWALPQIKLVTAHGLMGGKASGFRPDDPLTAGDLGDLVAGLTGQEAPMAADPSAPVTIAQLDAQLVRALGLLPSARLVHRADPRGRDHPHAVLRHRGRRPPDRPARRPSGRAGRTRARRERRRDPRGGRLLGGAHPRLHRRRGRLGRAAGGDLPASRALRQPAGRPPGRALVRRLPVHLGRHERASAGSVRDRQAGARRVRLLRLRVAGLQAAGLHRRREPRRNAEGPHDLRDERRGAPAKRIGIAKLQPGDLVFFGSGGPKSKPADINHMGIYLGGGWFVQASSQGVALAPLSSAGTRSASPGRAAPRRGRPRR